MRSYIPLIITLAIAFISPEPTLSQDYLNEEQTQAQFGNLNRPAEVLLAELEARVSRAHLAVLLQEHLQGKTALLEHRRKTRIILLDPQAVELDEITKEEKRLEQFLKQTESQIRESSEKLDSSWLLPVQTNIDDQKWFAMVNKAPLVLVTLRSTSGSVLSPVKLTLTSRSETAIGFTEIRPGAYLASPPVGEYQLAWQLTDKSIVQRKTGFKVEKPVCLVYEVTLGSPDITITSEERAITLPPMRAERSSTESSDLLEK
ncbi:MAG: hypothetical protein U1A77_11170 [Pirellulales bacterium]